MEISVESTIRNERSDKPCQQRHRSGHCVYYKMVHFVILRYISCPLTLSVSAAVYIEFFWELGDLPLLAAVTTRLTDSRSHGLANSYILNITEYQKGRTVFTAR